MGLWCEPGKSHAARFDGNDSVSHTVGRPEDLAGELHGGKPLLQSAYSAAGAVSALGRISTGGRPVDQRGAANECDARIEATISEFDCAWNCVQLFARLFAACGASGDPRGMGGRSWDGKNDFDLPRTAARCERRKSSGAQESLQNVQRLHDGTAERITVGMLPAGSAVQE